MSWEIKGKDNQTKATVYALEYNGEWMGESYVSVTIESPSPIAFAIGDYLMYRGERFEINYDPGKIKSAPQFAKGDAFKYENVKFNSLADELTRCDFRDVVLQDNNLHFTSLPKFTFFGGVQDLANRIQANLDKLYTGANKWSVVVSPEFQGGKELNVSVDNIKVRGALEILVNQFETYYTIKGRTITIGAAGVPAGHLFKYGKGNGLYEIEQNAEADQAIVTRLRAYGSTRNLPHRYYNSLTGADGQKLIPDNMAVQNLMLPSFPYTTQDPFIDSANKAALGIREDTIFFDGSQEGLEEIYPSIEGMTAEQLKAAGVPCNSTGALDVIVSAEQMTDDGVGEINEGEAETTATPPTFKVTLKDLGFNINDHLTTETATISFKTGMLGGRDFEIVKCTAIKTGDKTTGYELELNRVYDDGIKLWFPYKNYNAKTGDKFVLLYTKMPEVYIKAAAQRLLEAATAWLAKNDYSRSVYAPKVDEIFMARQHDEAMASGGSIVSLHDTLKEGMLLLFEDEDLSINASIFIDRLTIKEGDGSVPTYEVVLKEEKTVGRLDKMQDQIDSLASGGGQGGYNASQIRSMIEAYGGTRFLSKLKDDRAKGKIASDMGFEIGNYLAGVSGGIFGKDADGDTFIEIARLYVRVRAFFEQLTIIEANTLAGKQYITPGDSIKCTKVEEVTNANAAKTYRCYFLSEQDGEKTETKIIVGDQAISQMFNAKAGTTNKVSNHRYWRLVTGVNNDAYADSNGNHYGYIELSATDCESGSDIPKAGDIIAQLGNRTDRTRQTAIIISTVDADSPSMKFFSGINSFSLADRATISFGSDPTTGQIFFRLGASGSKQYLEYTQSRGLTIAGSISILSTVGDTPINQYVNDAAQSAAASVKEELQKQIDGVIEAFNGQGAPTLTNYPANGWTTDAERKRHDKDIYTDITPYVDDTTTPTSGQSWKWYYNSPTDYGWVKIADSEAVRALQLAQMSVLDTDVLYISHTSQTTAPATPVVNTNGVITDYKGWATTAPAWSASKYIWQTTYVKKGDGTAYFSDPTCIQGARGEQGPQGVPGAPGADGQATYTWIRYADNANGGGISNDPTGKKYIGFAYNKTTQTESNTPSDYTWSLIQGPQGPKGDKGDQGVKGADGRGVVSATTTYQLGTSGTTAPTGTWSSNVPTLEKGKYLWTRSVTTYTSGNPTTLYSVSYVAKDGNDGADGIPGKDGVGIASTTISYTKSTSGTTAPTTGWQSTIPTVPAGQYLWTKTVWKYTDGTDETGYSVAQQGKTTYFHIKYAPVQNPTAAQMTETPSDYIGTYVDYTEADSNDPSKYTWARFKGLQGADGAQGIPGVNGADGKTSYLHIKYSNDGGATFTPATGGLAIGETPGDYIGQYTDFTQADSTSVSDYTWSKIKGDQGVPGVKGADGIQYYTWIKYSDNADGTGMYDTPNDNTKYIGIAVNKTTQTESSNKSDYTWSRFRGADGTSITITSKGVTYSTVHTATQPADSTFTLTSVPTLSAGDYLWSRTKVTYSNGESTVSYGVSRIGTDGAAGADYVPNLLVDSKGPHTITSPSNNYYYLDYFFDTPIEVKVGDKFTVSVGDIEVLAGTPTGFTVYMRNQNGESYGSILPITKDKPWVTLTVSKDTVAKAISIYAGPAGATAGNSVKYTDVMLVKGESPATWVPAASEMSAPTIVSTDVKYAKSTTATQPADSAFTYSSIGATGVGAGDYLWSRTEVTYSDSESTKTYTVSRIGSDGADGMPGTPGANGLTPYVHWAYANSANGVTGFSTTYFADALYVGTCTDYTQADPTTPSSYEWARLRGNDGTNAKTVVVNANATAFTYSDEFATLVGPQSIALSATLQGTSGYQWSYKLPGQSSFTNISGATSATYALAHNASIWGSGTANKAITLRCTSGGVHDEVTIVRVSSGSNGANYSPNLIVGSKAKLVYWATDFANNNTFSVAINSDGFAETTQTRTALGGANMHIWLLNPASHLNLLAAGGIELFQKPNTKFTLSFEYKSTAKIDCELNVRTGNSDVLLIIPQTEFPPSSEWTRAVVTGVVPEGGIGDRYKVLLNASLRYSDKDSAAAVGDTAVFRKFCLTEGESGAYVPAASEMSGEDACTVVLSNESHVFEGDTEKAISSTAECSVFAYKGATRIAATIGTISGMPTGMTVTRYSNATTLARFAVSVTTALTAKQGVLNVPVTVDGKTFTKKFSWSLSLKGKDGRGIESTVEMYAVSSSNTTAPADSAFSTTVPTTTTTNRYLWNYEITTYTDNTSEPTQKRVIGVHGQNGADGAGISSITNYYLASASASGVTASTSGWTTDASSAAATTTDAKPYLWNYEKVTYTKGSPTTTTPHVIGKRGVGIDSITEQYYLSDSRVKLQGGTWNDSKPAWEIGKFYWTRSKITYTNGNQEFTSGVCVGPESGYTDNLLPGTRDWSGWDTFGHELSSDYMGLKVLHCNNSQSSQLLEIAKYSGVSLKNDKVYTMSFFARGSGNLSSYLHPDVSEEVYYQDGSAVNGNTRPDTWTERVLNNEWTRYYTVFRTKASGSLVSKVFLIRAEAGCQAWVAGAKLEEDENLSPQWTPASNELAAEPVYILDLDKETAPIACDSSGSPVSTGVLATTKATVFRGATEDSGWALSVIFTGCSGAQPSGGIIYVTAMTADVATVEVRAQKAGASTLKATMSLYKVLPGADGADAVLYTIEPSVSSITKSINGEFTNISANMLGCKKYKTVGDAGRQETAEKCLKYKLEGAGVDTNEYILADVGSISTQMATVDSSAEAIIFTLYEDATSGTVLYRERVPVVSDLGDLSISGDNIAFGTGNAWQLSGNKISGTTATKLYVLDAITVGSTITVSFDYDVKNMSFGSNGYIFVSGSLYYNSAEWSGRITSNGTGHMSKTITITKVPSNAAQRFARLRTSGVNGSGLNSYIRITNFKVERGCFETAWKPNSSDYNYITEALLQGGTLDAGLILARLLRLGYSDSSGVFHNTSGMNGLIKNIANPTDLAIWSGGDPGEYMDESLVAMGWRHDGTGFAAHNTIRFKDSTVELGDGMELTDSELCLKDNSGNKRYVISRDSVGTPEDYLANINISISEALEFTAGNITVYKDSAESEFGFESSEKAIGTYNSIPSGSTVRVNVDSFRQFTYGAWNGNEYVPSTEAWAENMLFSTSLRFYFRETSSGISTYRDIPYLPESGISSTVGKYRAKGTAEYTIQSSTPTTLSISACLIHSNIPGASAWQAALAGGVSGTVTGKIGRLFASMVKNGSDGWVSVWPNAAALVRDGVVLFRVGDYGLWLDKTNGIRIDRNDGKGWVKL